MVKELLKAGKHQVTAITRTNSKAVMPEGVKVARVDYDNHSSLVSALRGQDALVITLSIGAQHTQQPELIDAAAEAGVAWILPNEWGIDKSDEEVAKQLQIGAGGGAICRYIEGLGKSSWIGVVTGFWYEFSLAGSGDRYGFDFQKRSVTFPINTSTWPQCGRAVANLLALPDSELSKLKNKHVYVSSFLASQKDMFESALRVTKTKPEDWHISFESSKDRYQRGVDILKSGDPRAHAIALYTRVFFPDRIGAFEETKGLQNELLGLPKEDIDEATKIAAEWKDFKY
jgi:hypothetical protein